MLPLYAQHPNLSLRQNYTYHSPQLQRTRNFQTNHPQSLYFPLRKIFVIIYKHFLSSKVALNLISLEILFLK